MDDETWNDILDTMTASEPTAVEPVPETDTPVADPALTDEEPPTPVADAPSEPVSVADTAEPVTEEEPEETPAPAFDWRTDPEAQTALQEAEQFRQLKATLAEAQRIRAQQEFQQHLTDLADGDPERYQQLTGVLARATAPLQQHIQATRTEAEQTAQAASALWLAMEDALDDQTRAAVLAAHDRIMRRLPEVGPFAMQDMITERRAQAQHLATQLTQRDQEIAALRQQLAARAELTQRQASGADAVDGGGGSALDEDIRTRLANAQDFDEYWALLMGRAA